ncbi:MAG: flagellar basal body P-ring protein FlgI [Betaproteobacteria bacterium]|nr:flagellar basal body P-ring protein FlgI [Betaproteobacteria bacterium]
MKLFIVLLTALASLLPSLAHADRVKDLVTVAAMRPNQLVGYGLVVGLEGTGDGTDVSFTVQSMRAMLSRLGVSLEGALTDFEQAPARGRNNIQNVAAVMITAELPGMSKPGQKIDINVSAIGRAKSLRGGNLLLTSLRGIDGQVYALAQGPLTATGVEASAAGSKVSIGVPTSARIPGGGIVERTIDTPFEKSDHVVLNLREPDFTTATAIVKSVNEKYGAGIARAIDPVSIAIRAPEDVSQRVAFISMIENMDVIPGEPPARVVVNARTGTVVISRNVKVSASAVSHGTISVRVSATNEVSQPNPLSQGQTAAVQNADISISDPRAPMFLFQPGVDLKQIVDAVNQVGATPSALIAILEALKNSGGLRAELIII